MDSPEGQAEDVVHEELLLRARQLMSEMVLFADHYSAIADTSSHNGSQLAAGALNHLKQQLKSEIQGLERVVDRLKSNDPTAIHSLSSTNLPFFEALWAFAKRSRGIVSFRKWVCTGTFHGNALVAPGRHIVNHPGDSVPSKSTTTLVDIIADGGQSWIKISTITVSRMRWDMTNLGLVEEDLASLSSDELDDVPIFKMAKALTTSARAYRIRNKHPATHLVLPRISSGEFKDVDLVLDQIRKLPGINVICSNDMDLTPSLLLTSDLLHQMVPNPFSNFSEYLNIDTSVLIALVSDFSHDDVEKQPWFSSMQLGHLANEKKRRITTWLYPAMGSHELICTKEAVDTCRNIVETIGTATEMARLKLLLCEDPGMTQEHILEQFRLLSNHEIPELRFPIRIIADTTESATLSPQAWKALDSITEPTRSVFAYGWATNQTTLTSNGQGISSLTRNLESLEDAYDGPFPSIWLSPFSRSLVGVPKRIREESDGKHPALEDGEKESNAMPTGPSE
jgi:hypothetical protein